MHVEFAPLNLFLRDIKPPPDRILALLARALDGEARAGRELTETILLPLLDAAATRFLLRSSERRFEKADVIHDVFEHLYGDRWAKLRPYNPERGSFAAYVWSITGNWIRDHSRRRLAPRPVADPELDMEPDSGPEGKVELALILDRLEAELDDEEFALFQWIYMEGAPLDVAATRLQLSKEALYKRKQRLEARIRSLIAGEHAERPEPKGGAR